MKDQRAFCQVGRKLQQLKAETGATIEIIKLAVSSTLKAATKISIGGEVGIEGTFEILYLVGYEVKKAEDRSHSLDDHV